MTHQLCKSIKLYTFDYKGGIYDRKGVSVISNKDVQQLAVPECIFL
jgi:hypothetical protein